MLVCIHVSINLVTSPCCQGILKWFAKFWRWPIADHTTSSMLSTQKMQFEGNGCSQRNNQSKYVMWLKSPMRMLLYDVRVWGLYGCYFLPYIWAVRWNHVVPLNLSTKCWLPCQTCIKRVQNIYMVFTLCVAYGIEYIRTK